MPHNGPSVPGVWIVTRWEWGGGGDDSTEIVGVYATADEACGAAQERDEVTAYPIPWTAAAGSTEPRDNDIRA
jgi:hypothetical protein